MVYSIIQKSQLEGAKRMDAEYYQPEFLKLIKSLENLGAIPIKEIVNSPKRKFKPVKGEKFEYIEISEINLENGEYNTCDILGENTPDRAQWIVKKDDVIISTVRPIRNAVSLISDENKNLVCSSGFAVLRTEKIDPEYLFVYLKTKSIIKLLNRLTTATMYPAVTIEDILNAKIYLGDINFRKNIKEKVIELKSELLKSKSLYHQAENLLLKELGLRDFEAENNLSSVVNLSEILEARRMDAEYFQPKYKNLIGHIRKNCNGIELGELVSVKKGIEPGAESYQEFPEIPLTPFIQRGQNPPTPLLKGGR